MRKSYFLLIILFFHASVLSQIWQKADQPDGGNISYIDASPLDTNQIVLMVSGFLEGFVYYSANGGVSWEKIGKTTTPGPVRIDIKNNRIYSSGFNMVQVTTDYGITWDTLLTESGYVDDLAFNPHNPSEILITDYFGVHRSSDFGLTWKLVYDKSKSSFQNISFSPHDPGHVIIKSSLSSINSSDGGISWDSVSIPNSYYDSPILFDPEKKGILYTESYRNDTSYTIWSTDYGLSWQIKNVLHWTLNICYQENNETVFLGNGWKGIYKSTDFGVSWTPISKPFNSNKIFYSGKKLYASFSSTGFAVYEGDSTWLSRNKGLREHQINSMAAVDSLILLSTFNNVFRKNGANPEAEWESVRPDSALFNLVLLDSRIGFGTNRHSTVYKTTDGGASWFLFSNFQNWWLDIRDLKIINNRLFAALEGSYSYESGIVSTPLNQASWTTILTGFNSKIMFDGKLLYGFSDYNPSMLLKSSDLGIRWQEAGLLRAGMDYSSFAKKDNPAGILIGGYRDYSSPHSGGIVYFIPSDDDIKTIYEGTSIYGIAAPIDRKELYIIRTSQGIILKADSIGGGFYPYEEGLSYIPVDQGYRKLYYSDAPGYTNKIFTNRGGFMELELSTPVQVEPDISIYEFSLSQNYPNPFNPSTKIIFSIPRTEHVSVIIYDILGREITRLIDNELNPGSYETEFKGTDISSGIYFYKLTAGELTEIRKMMLIK
jgi:photosystem II stability/assembly factor-like uncharacterized protein